MKIFHLFKKIYLNFDNRINADIDRVVISAEHGHGLLTSLIEISYGELFDKSLSVADLIGADKKYPNYLSFFKKLNELTDTSGKRVVVYADAAAFYKLASAWLKIVCPNIDAASAHKALKYYFVKDKLYGLSPFVEVRRNYEIDSTPYDINLDLFTTIFNGTENDREISLEFLNSIVSTLSVEYLLASYLYDGSYKDALKSRTLILTNTNTQQLLFETKSLLSSYIGRRPFQQLLGIADLSITSFESLHDHPRLSHWFDQNIWVIEGIGTHHEHSKINFQAINAETVQKFKDDLLLINNQWEHVDVTSDSFRRLDFIDSVINNTFTDEEFDAAIDFELNGNTGCTIFRDQDKDRINFYLIDYLIDSYKSNNRDNLIPYKLS